MQKIKFFTLAIIAMLSVNFAWGADKTASVNIGTLVSEKEYIVSSGSTINTKCLSIDLDDNINLSLNGSGNNGSFWGTTTIDWRAYQNQSGTYTLTAKNGATLKSVTFTFTIDKTGTLNTTGTGSNITTGKLTSGTALSLTGTSKTFYVGNTGKATNGQVRITAISVTYTPGSSCEEPEVAKYDGACQTNTDYDLEENCFLSENTSAITFTCTSSNKSSCTISGSTFRATAAGTYEIKATQAEDGTYCAVVETFNVVVTAPTCYVTFLNNGQPISGTGIDAQGRKQYHEGDQLGTLPTLTSAVACDATSTTFMGWTSDAGFQKRAAPPSSFVTPSTTVTGDMTLRAVWARAQ